MSASSSDSQLQQLFELLSAQHDGVLSAADQQLLGDLTARYPLQAQQFQSGCRQVTSALRSLPRTTIPAPIVSVQSAVADVPWLIRTPVVAKRRYWARLAAVVSTAAVLGLVVMFQTNQPRQVAVRMQTDHLLQSSAPAGPVAAAPAAPAVAAPAVAASDAVSVASPQPAEQMLADAAPELQQQMAPAEIGAASATSADPVVTLAKTPDWKVVLVKVGAADRQDVRDKVQGVLQQHGLLLADTAPVQMPDWLGVVLTSDSLLQQSLVQAVSMAVGGAPAEWNPSRILSASREELIEAVRRSLESPTQAELARGEIYVAVRDEPAASESRSRSAPARQSDRLNFYSLSGRTSGYVASANGQAQLSPGAGGGGSSKKSQQAKADQAQAAGQNQVTLFVFQFSGADNDSGETRKLPQ